MLRLDRLAVQSDGIVGAPGFDEKHTQVEVRVHKIGRKADRLAIGMLGLNRRIGLERKAKLEGVARTDPMVAG